MNHSTPSVAKTTKGDDSKESAASRDQLVSEQAYALYEARGKVDGHALEDWLEAEARVGLAISVATVAHAARTADHETA